MSTNISLRAKKMLFILLVATLIAMLSYMLNIKAEQSNGNYNQVSIQNNQQAASEIELEVLKELKNEIRMEEKQKENEKENEKEQEQESIQQTINMNQYSRVTVTATGYTAGVESTGKTPNHPQYGITFSGIKVQRDPEALSTIAADINIFPLGTILFIPGYGYGVVADTGSAIKGYKIDLYYDTVEEVYEHWGKKTVEVYVIQEGNGKLTEELLNHYNQVAIANSTM